MTRDRFADTHVDDGMRHSDLVPTAKELREAKWLKDELAREARISASAARSDLARKVLETVEAKYAEYKHECDEAAKIEGGDYPNFWAARARAMSHMADLLRELFQKEGVIDS